MEELIPDRQRETKIYILWSVQLVVNAVKVRADEYPFERPEAQIGIRVRERDRCSVDDEKGGGQGTIGKEHDPRDQGDEVGDMNEGMRAKDREHAHILLGVVQLMEAPEHPDAVIRQMGKPIQPVHGNEDDDNRAPTRHRAELWQDDPWEAFAGNFRESETQRDYERHNEYRVEHRIEEVLAVTAGEERSPLCRMQPLHNEEDPDNY